MSIRSTWSSIVRSCLKNFPKYLQKFEKEDEDYSVNLWIKKYFLVSRRRRGDLEETKIF
jgi:hypothetical protein